MKKLAFLLILILSVGFVSSASSLEASSSNSSSDFPQVCKFSVSPSAGKMDSSAQTENFEVSVSCVQDNDVHATVSVYVDKLCVGSKVVTVSKGKISSPSTWIKVSSEYADKHYTLTVE